MLLDERTEIGTVTSQPGHGVAAGGGGGRAGEDIRRLNPAAIAAIEPYAGSPLLAGGQLVLVSLDAVVERIGVRWAMRRDTVYDYTERTLARHIGDDANIMRVSDADYLVAVPGLKRCSAQLQCLRGLSEVLTYFLGEARPMDLSVREITSITQEGVVAVLINPVAAAAAADRELAQQDQASAPASRVDRWTPFVAANGRRIRVSCVLEPVFELKTYTRIGYRIARRVLHTDTEAPLTADELRVLSRSDIERIDCATIARGLDRLRAETGGERQLSLIIPVSYICLSNRQSRAVLAGLFGEAKSLVTMGVICEVCDIEDVPQAALLEATSLIRPFCVFLIGRLNAPPDRGHGNLRGAGLQAVSFEAPQGLAGDAEFLGWAKAATEAAKTIAKSVLIYRLSSSRHAGLASLLGVTHASVRTGGQAPAVTSTALVELGQ
jgi:hypothetical protein